MQLFLSWMQYALYYGAVIIKCKNPQKRLYYIYLLLKYLFMHMDLIIGAKVLTVWQSLYACVHLLTFVTWRSWIEDASVGSSFLPPF